MTLVALLAAAGTSSAAVTQKQAADKALAALGTEKRADPVIVFGLPKPVRAGTKITQAGTPTPSTGSSKGIPSSWRSAGVRTVRAPSVLNVRTRSYFFYEDRGPFQLYQHPGRVAVVDVATGRVRLSRTITWPPLLNGRLPAFLKNANAYRSSKYQVLNRPWEVDPNAKQPRVAQRNLFDQDPFGPGKPLPSLTNDKAIAARLAAERSCVLRVTDTLPTFWNVNELNLTRTFVGTLFDALERANSGFIDDRYGARTGESLGEAVDRLTGEGCKDILLYIAGQGFDADGQPVIQIGTSVRPGGLLAQQNITAASLRSLVAARPGVTFKFKFDAPYSGGFIDRLKDLSNVLLIETPSQTGAGAFAGIPSVEQSGQMVPDGANPAGLLEFTNCELVGLKAFFDSTEEIDKATQAQNEGVSFLAEMLARSQELCKGVGFADDLGMSPQLYAAKRGSGNGTNRPPNADKQDVTVTEDTPKSITLVATDPDGDPLTYTITKQPDHGTLSGSGNTRTYTPNANYTGPDDFSFKATDDDGADSNTAKVSITVVPGNDAPVVTNSPGATAYTEQGAAVVVDSSLTVSDVDDTQLEGATVRISSGFQSGDELVFVNQLGISGTYNSGTGVLTLSGTASVSDYQTAMRDIRYRNLTNDNPSSPKTVEFKANDGSADSAASTKNVSVTGVNDAPVLDTTDAAQSYTENSGGVVVDGGITAADPDSATFAGATVQITGNHVQAEDDLIFFDQSGITGSYNDASGTLTLTGTATVAEYQAALRSVQYQNNSENPSTATRTVSYRVNDGGAVNNLSNIATRDINITRTNDAPVVNTSAGDTSYTEGDPGTVVDGGLTVSDIDDTNIEGAEVRISSGFESGDDLTFVNTATITGSYNTGTGVLTLSGTDTVANYQAALRSITFDNTVDDNLNSPKVISFKVNDGDVDSNTATKNIVVTPVNDAPTLTTTASTLSYTEGDGAVDVDTGLTISDPDDTNIESATVQITGNHVQAEDDLVFVNQNGISGSYSDASGTLTLTGTATLAQYQTALRSVEYQNTSDNPSTATRTVSFKVNDGALDSNTGTRDISVARTNDAPTVTTSAGATSYTEGDPGTTVDGALTVTDPDDTNIESAQVRISTGFQFGDDLIFVNQNGISGFYSTGTGVLTLTGTSSVANYQTALRSIQFRHTGDDPAGGKTIEFKVNDGDVDSNLATKTINITGVNDGAVLTTTASTLAYTEGNGAVAVDTGLTLDDPENHGITGATVQITGNFNSAEDDLVFTNQGGITGSYNDTNGTLTLSGTASEATYQTALRSVQYQNTSDNPSTSTRTVTFQTTGDTGSPSQGSNSATRNISVAPANDAPVVTTSAGSTSYTEGGAAATVDGSLTVTDADDTNIEGGQVRISSGFQSGDDLVFVNQNGISGVYNSGTGVLTLTGTSSVANYQTALRSIQFQSTNQQPVTSKTVEFKVNDGDVDSNLATKEIAVTPTNDGPIVTSGGTLSYTENDPATAVHSGMTIDDLENDNLSGGSASITANYQAGQDFLNWVDNNLADNITLDNINSSQQTIVLTGIDTEANYQAALRAVTYQNGSDNPSTLNRTVTFSATDQPGLTGSATRTISVTAVDDPPTAVADSATVLEDAAATAIPVLTNDTDPDGGPKTISSATDPTNGTVVLTGGSPGAHTGLTYQPDPNYCNDPPNTTPDTFNYTVNGGSSAQVSMTVTCVNDAPVADDETFNGNDSAHGNTTLQVDDPDDNKAAPTNPHTEITGDILAGDTDIDGPGPLTVTPGTFATNDGGSVTLESDGDFVFQPAPSTSCTDTSDFFDYTVEDSGSPEQTDTGRVTIAIAGCVWYVSNNAAGNSGTSVAPFDTLAQAETASGNNHTVFVFDGDNTSTGYNTGFQMNSGERLIGEHEGLVVDPDQGGALTADTLHPANPGAHPTLTGTNEDVVALDDGNEVRGFNLDPTGTGSGIAGASGDTGGGTIDDVNITDTAVAGSEPLLELDSTTGTFNISNIVVNNQAAVSPPSTATGVRLNNAGTVNFNPTGQTSIGISGAKGLDAISTNMGSGSTFDDITVAGSGVGGVNLSSASGTTAFGDGTGSDLSLTTTSGSSPAFGVLNSGTVTVDAAGADDLHATGGPALDVSGTSGATLAFDDVDSTNSANDGINIDGLGTGTFSASSGDIGGAAGIGFDLNSGSGAITYPGTFGNGSGTFVAEITNRSGGVVSLSGSISDTNDSGGGINLVGNTGGSTVFSGATKQLNTGTVDGVDFQASDGHTLVLSGGGTDIDTTSGRGIDADTSGTIQVSGSGNTVLTDTGRAVNVANTDIAAADMTFDSVRANSDLAGSGPDFGIRLVSTGSAGNLAVTGTGGDCTSTASCTGGVIHNTTSDGVRIDDADNTSLTDLYVGDSDGTGIYTINGASSSSLNDVFIHNNGNAVSAAGIPDAGIAYDDVTGTHSITGTSATAGATTVQQSRNNQIEWDQSAGTGTLNISNTDVLNAGQGPSTGANGISVVSRGSSTANLNVGNGGAGTGDVDIDTNPADGILTNSTDTSTITSDVDNVNLSNGNRAINHSGGSTATTVFRVNNSDINFFNPPADTGSAASTVSINPTVNAQFDGTITNNRIGTTGQNGSGAGRNFGIVVGIEDGSDMDLNISNNNVTETAQEGIFIYARDFLSQAGSITNANVTLRDNVVSAIENLPSPDTFTNLNGMEVEAQHDSIMCADIANNDSDSVGSSATTGTELRTRQLGTSTFRLEGLPANSNVEATVEAFLNSRNPLIPVVEIDSQVTTQYTAEPGDCPMPSLP